MNTVETDEKVDPVGTREKFEDTREFGADIQQLMNLIVNSFYSNNDIFLRELISNASDAINKQKFAKLTSKDTGTDTTHEDYCITITPSENKKYLTIEDNGVGMNGEELCRCLGTIATSGTKSFIEAISSSTSSASDSMIGQFGVGFYSAFLVAENVEVVTRKENDASVWTWKSDGKSGYSISEAVRDGDESVISHGTRIVLKLKSTDENEDVRKYADETTLRQIILKHSQFVAYPIKLWTKKSREVKVHDDGESKTSDDGAADDGAADDGAADYGTADYGTADDVTVEDVPDVQFDESKESSASIPIVEEYHEWVVVNEEKPIWTKPPSTVSDEEYESFYKTISGNWDKYATKTHFSIEGNLQFTTLLYIPKRAPFNMFTVDEKKNSKMKLYARRVLISDECDDLLPDWLNFVSGVVDSYDLPLNVSREILQENKFMSIMKKHIVKKCIAALTSFAEDEAAYAEWYPQFSKSLKLGVHEDSRNIEKLAILLRLDSTHCNDETETDETGKTDDNDNNDFNETKTGATALRTLDQYVENMKEGQPGIYYITGETRAVVCNSPFIEKLKKLNYEVLYMTDPMDEYMLQKLKEYNGHKFISVTTVSLEGLDEDLTSLQESYSATCDFFVEVLGKKHVEKVVVSKRVVESPACLVTADHGLSANMERILKAQALSTSQARFMFHGKKTLEINPEHPIIKTVYSAVEAGHTNEHTRDLVELVYDTTVLTSGFTLERPHVFSKRIHRIIATMTPVLHDTSETKEEIVQ